MDTELAKDGGLVEDGLARFVPMLQVSTFLYQQPDALLEATNGLEKKSAVLHLLEEPELRTHDQED